MSGCTALPPTAEPTSTSTAEPIPTSTTAFSETLVRGPYLQSVTPDSIIVVWETEDSSRGEIVYGETDEYGSSVTDPEVGTNHAVTLTNLAPYTTYHYRVEEDGVPLSADAAFRTAAGPDQTKFTFVAFGDTRTQHQIHQEIVDRIVELEPDFALHTGDLVYKGNEFPYWEDFFEIEKDGDDGVAGRTSDDEDGPAAIQPPGLGPVPGRDQTDTQHRRRCQEGQE